MSTLTPFREPSPAPAIKKTQATQLLARLRSDIVRGHMPPGERLVISALAEALDAGQTPIREALMRLVSEGLVTLEDQRGFSVAPVSRSELLDLTATRAEIEALALRWAIQQGDDNWEAGLLGAYHRLQKAHKLASDGLTIDPAWEERHNHFHAMLVGACSNKVLLQLRAQLYDRADRYRNLSTRYLKAPRDDLGEHEAIMKAALSRNCAEAERLLKAHIHLTVEIILAEGAAQVP
ncbi:MAG: GntR family transcriptional regulator [Cupriavidus necator]